MLAELIPSLEKPEEKGGWPQPQGPSKSAGVWERRDCWQTGNSFIICKHCAILANPVAVGSVSAAKRQAEARSAATANMPVQRHVNARVGAPCGLGQ